MRPRKQMRAYVGCSLTQAPKVFKANVEAFKADLRKNGYEVLDFVGLEAGTALDVYRWDLEHCVGSCDVFIGICDLPSLGLGFEINQAIHLGKPTLLVAHEDAKVTRMVLGTAEAERYVSFERYSSLTDVLTLVQRLRPRGQLLHRIMTWFRRARSFMSKVRSW
ncbi:hypothetical protein TM7_0539 [candidate division TM7 genomosp. GTL1]|nr:hypothetical protein TM7_0539 [candidate division TM7 genomosp. GTL1]